MHNVGQSILRRRDCLRDEKLDGSLDRSAFQAIEELLEARGIAPSLGGHSPYEKRPRKLQSEAAKRRWVEGEPILEGLLSESKIARDRRGRSGQCAVQLYVGASQ